MPRNAGPLGLSARRGLLTVPRKLAKANMASTHTQTLANIDRSMRTHNRYRCSSLFGHQTALRDAEFFDPRHLAVTAAAVVVYMLSRSKNGTPRSERRCRTCVNGTRRLQYKKNRNYVRRSACFIMASQIYKHQLRAVAVSTDIYQSFICDRLQVDVSSGVNFERLSDKHVLSVIDMRSRYAGLCVVPRYSIDAVTT